MRIWRLCCALGVLLLPAAGGAETSEAVLFRIFLRDGSMLVSYGEYARVGDRVVFSLPLSTAANPPLHLTSVPESAVDWTKTEQYALSARVQHYQRTRGEADFAALSADVADALNAIARTESPDQRLARAQAIRRRVAEWPGRHYGYRADEVREIAGLLDEVVAELRAAAGAQAFDLNLVALTLPPPTGPLLPAPTLQDLIAQALTAARTTPEPAERMSLLQSVVSALVPRAPDGVPEGWAATVRATAARELAAEVRIERAYGDLAQLAVARAATYAARAPVRAVEAVGAMVRKRDRAIGGKRPDQVNAILAAVNARLAAARQLRLARDRWELHRAAYQRYERATTELTRTFAEARAWLEDIRALAGPDVAALAELEQRMDRALGALERIAAPGELSPVHEILRQALQLGRQAARVRRDAILSGDLDTAWSASSAAAGAMMLADRARADLADLLKPPELR